ncbi:Sarcolemmal membrane-associated protein [Actinidia chinensis var. chinensis]|uniref:Sarcolemmal membrane-associated protein n=1 Tax=Actinidia chinensis var. chinensis TaxID=1590841 RepID=A0A2R6QHH3_ACTCC|nr:Sarcolemmal membrane-associated protein [Actinidia chinensis var. chinensis]
MHLRSRYLPRPSASSPPNNKAPPMANTSQAPDLEGLHREIHCMAEQMRILNENNARLVQLLATANPPPPTAPPIPNIERSHHFNRSGGRSQNLMGGEEMERGRIPRRGDRIGAQDKSTSQKIRDIDARLDAINTRTNALVTVDTLIRQTEPLFTKRVLRARVSFRFKLPTQLGIYEGKTDPMDHLDSYKSLISLQGCSDEVMCKAFSATLKGSTRSWFRKLLPGTIDSFGNLSQLFVANFMSCKNRQKNASHLFTVHQKETESLKDFVKRFNQTVLEVEDPSDKVVIMEMMEGL